MQAIRYSDPLGPLARGSGSEVGQAGTLVFFYSDPLDPLDPLRSKGVFEKEEEGAGGPALTPGALEALHTDHPQLVTLFMETSGSSGSSGSHLQKTKTSTCPTCFGELVQVGQARVEVGQAARAPAQAAASKATR